ncbi:MAG: hypothetical protein JOS17DRAFT_272892 [Linnemannia elongata]|nr:MAG: hypothetical protein JOS17DRAFT_272892 [Linnemannia elongata]
MGPLRTCLASCLQPIKACIATKRGHRFLLAIPILVGIYLILSIQIIETIDLGRLSGAHNDNDVSSNLDRQAPLEGPTFDINGDDFDRQAPPESPTFDINGDNLDRQAPPDGPTPAFDIDGNQVLEPNNRWRARTVAKEIEIPDSTWTCTDDGLSQSEKDTQKIKRTRQCVVKNLCVDRKGKQKINKHYGPLSCIP